MGPPGQGRADDRAPNLRFAVGLARAFGGAVIFALPLLLTMEMWWLGFYMEPLRLALLIVVTLPLLVGLSHFIGFEETFRLRDDAVDAFVAWGVGFTAAAGALFLLGVIAPGMSTRELVGKVSLQAVPASIGALLAQSTFGQGHDKDESRWGPSAYWRELFLMAVGALFLALPVAPTEEMVLLAYRMENWRALALGVASVLIMHAFVYAVGFRGRPEVPPGTPAWSLFLRYTVVGYAVVLLIAAYVLWTFGRFDGTSLTENLTAVIVLAFPGAVGAAAARLIL